MDNKKVVKQLQVVLWRLDKWYDYDDEDNNDNNKQLENDIIEKTVVWMSKWMRI